MVMLMKCYHDLRLTQTRDFVLKLRHRHHTKGRQIKREVFMRPENKINKAWDQLVAGDVESVYKVLAGARLTSWHREVIRQANFLKTYEYPELEIIEEKARNEFALVASWNFLIEKNANQWAKIDNLAPLLGHVFGFKTDIKAIRDFLGHTVPISIPFTPEQCYEQWPELLTLPSLTLGTRNIFIRTLKYAQIGFGGLANTQVIANMELLQTKQAFIDLTHASLVKTDLTLSDVLMSKTVKELKQFLFDHNLTSHGTKYQLIQAIVSTVDQSTIKKWLDFKNEKEFVYPLVSNLSLLKNYIWAETTIIEDYINWICQTKHLDKPEQASTVELANKPSKNNYDPMKPSRPPLYNKRTYNSKGIWESKKMHLLKSIWGSDCDLILKDIVQRYAWDWDINIEKAITIHFTEDKLIFFQKACSRNSVLWQFCYQRLDELNIEVRSPSLITCAGCGIDFMDWSIDSRLSEKVGYKIRFCQNCYYCAFSDWGIGNQVADKSTMLEQILTAANILGVVPTSSFRRSLSLAKMPEENQVELVKVLLSMPSHKKFIDAFGSWLQTLILAGVLQDGTQQTSRGVRCIAIDGHICSSMAEKTVDDWLYSHGINHEKEPHYPYHPRLNPYKLRADWKVDNVLIEYAGLMNEPDYAAKMKAKQEIATQFGISLIILQPKDILDLDSKLVKLANKNAAQEN